MVEHEIIRGGQKSVAAVRVKRSHLARPHVNPLDRPALVVGASRAGHVDAGHNLKLKHPTVVGDVKGPVRADRKPVGTAARVRDNAELSIRGETTDASALDLREHDRAVGHRHWPFRELQSLGDQIKFEFRHVFARLKFPP